MGVREPPLSSERQKHAQVNPEVAGCPPPPIGSRQRGLVVVTLPSQRVCLAPPNEKRQIRALPRFKRMEQCARSGKIGH